MYMAKIQLKMQSDTFLSPLNTQYVWTGGKKSKAVFPLGDSCVDVDKYDH